MIKFKALRESRGISLRELSSLTGVGYTHIHRIETGEVIPSLDTTEKILNGLGYTLTITPIEG